MAQDFARKFYASKQWQDLRAYVLRRDHFLCVRCGAPGEIVHHKVYLTAKNISDPFVSLNEKNLETLCKDCHNLEHMGQLPADAALTFDKDGNVIKRNDIWMS